MLNYYDDSDESFDDLFNYQDYFQIDSDREESILEKITFGGYSKFCRYGSNCNYKKCKFGHTSFQHLCPFRFKSKCEIPNCKEKHFENLFPKYSLELLDVINSFLPNKRYNYLFPNCISVKARNKKIKHFRKEYFQEHDRLEFDDNLLTLNCKVCHSKPSENSCQNIKCVVTWRLIIKIFFEKKYANKYKHYFLNLKKCLFSSCLRTSKNCFSRIECLKRAMLLWISELINKHPQTLFYSEENIINMFESGIQNLV